MFCLRIPGCSSSMSEHSPQASSKYPKSTAHSAKPLSKSKPWQSVCLPISLKDVAHCIIVWFKVLRVGSFTTFLLVLVLYKLSSFQFVLQVSVSGVKRSLMMVDVVVYPTYSYCTLLSVGFKHRGQHTIPTGPNYLDITRVGTSQHFCLQNCFQAWPQDGSEWCLCHHSQMAAAWQQQGVVRGDNYIIDKKHDWGQGDFKIIFYKIICCFNMFQSYLFFTHGTSIASTPSDSERSAFCW